MNKRQVTLLNNQFFISLVLAITLLMSFLLTYDEKQKLLNKTFKTNIDDAVYEKNKGVILG